jgi:hypothetical protein
MKFSVLSEGHVAKVPQFQTVVIKNNEGLQKIWRELEISGEVPPVNFSKELVVAISIDRQMGDSLKILKVASNKDDVEVRYAIKAPTVDLKSKGQRLFPYILAKLYPTNIQGANVKFIEDIPKPPIPADNGIGQTSQYTNVLKEYENIAISEFLPLDKGNTWTYEVESKGRMYEETYSINSISDGWSVFDDFFGRKNIALKVDPSGNVLVSSDDGARGFYTPEIGKNFEKSHFSTPAGKFDDLLVVSIPKNDKFWFRDVYARGVGLIYHEHRSPKGNAKFTLIKAKVRGKNYP